MKTATWGLGVCLAVTSMGCPPARPACRPNEEWVAFLEQCVPVCERGSNGARCYADGAVIEPDASGAEAGVPDAMDAGDSGDAGDSAADAACSDGGSVCTGRCVDLQRDPAHCGACARACPAATGDEVAVCNAGVCGLGCAAGFERVESVCELRVARAIAPLSTARVSSRTPRLRWVLPSDLDGAHVEVCSDRVCARLLAEGDGVTEWTVPTALPPGVVFWRLRGTLRGRRSTRTSPLWWMWIPTQSAPGGVQSSWGSLPDLNGDGVGDVVVGDPAGGNNACAMDCLVGSVQVFNGVLESPRAPTQSLSAGLAGGGFGDRVNSIGDVNGDGFADIAVTESYFGALGLGLRGRVSVYLGGGMPLLRLQRTLDGPSDSAGFGTLLDGGDLNGDGYSDLVVSAPTRDAGGMRLSGEVTVYPGGPDGVAAAPSVRIGGRASDDLAGFGMRVVGDVNADGFADLMISSPGGVLRMPPVPGYAELYLGSASGVSTTPQRRVTSDRTDVFFGITLARGDYNGDGFADVFVGSLGADTGAIRPGGTLDVYLGSPSGLGATGTSRRAWTGEGSGPTAIAVQDLDGDARDDVVVLSNRTMVAGGFSGQVLSFLSSAGGLTAAPAWTIDSNASEDVGSSLALLGARDPFAERRLLVGVRQPMGSGFAVYTLSANGAAVTRASSYIDPTTGRALGLAIAGW
ncbi:MAG: FG-GAP-like repeat-containing protein [Deltaproteobacteria bacterium]|nr:FG-GAP-like repeat-containing protein [Deltaproteobacteria bacterium]